MDKFRRTYKHLIPRGWRGLRAAGISALVVLSLLLSACGSGGGGASNEPIKLGLVTSLTGSYASLGQDDRKGAQLAVDVINASGGVLGKQLQLIVKDEQTKPDQAVVALNSLVGEGISAVIGPPYSNSALAMIPAAQRASIPFMGAASSDQQVEPVRPYAFMATQPVSIVDTVLLQYFKSKGMTRMAVAYDKSSDFAVTGWNDMSKAAAQYGINFTDVETFEGSTTDFTPALTHIRAANVDGVMFWGSGSTPPIFMKQFASSGVPAPLIMNHADCTPNVTQAAGAAANNALFACATPTLGPDLPKSQYKDVVMAMATKFQAADGGFPHSASFSAYSAVELITTAMKTAKSTDPTKIRDALENLDALVPNGHFRYSATDHSGLSPDSISMARWSGSKFTPAG